MGVDQILGSQAERQGSLRQDGSANISQFQIDTERDAPADAGSDSELMAALDQAETLTPVEGEQPAAPAPQRPDTAAIIQAALRDAREEIAESDDITRALDLLKDEQLKKELLGAPNSPMAELIKQLAVNFYNWGRKEARKTPFTEASGKEASGLFKNCQELVDILGAAPSTAELRQQLPYQRAVVYAQLKQWDQAVEYFEKFTLELTVDEKLFVNQCRIRAARACTLQGGAPNLEGQLRLLCGESATKKEWNLALFAFRDNELPTTNRNHPIAENFRQEAALVVAEALFKLSEGKKDSPMFVRAMKYYEDLNAIPLDDNWFLGERNMKFFAGLRLLQDQLGNPPKLAEKLQAAIDAKDPKILVLIAQVAEQYLAIREAAGQNKDDRSFTEALARCEAALKPLLGLEEWRCIQSKLDGTFGRAEGDAFQRSARTASRLAGELITKLDPPAPQR